MMFSDGPQRRSIINSNDQKASIAARINGRIGTVQSGIKDELTKSLSRVLHATTLHRATHSSKPNRTTTPKVAPTTGKLLLQPQQQQQRSTPNKICTAINDKIKRDFKATQAAERRNRMRLTGGKSVEVQAKWVPRIENSFQRSLSFNQRETVDRLVSTGSWRGDQRPRSRNSFRLNAGPSEMKRGEKFSFSNQINKYETWLRTSLFTFLFILMSVLLILPLCQEPIDAAPLPLAEPQPIWLQDGLITIDPNLVDSDIDVPLSILPPSLPMGPDGYNRKLIDLQEDDGEIMQQQVATADREIIWPPDSIFGDSKPTDSPPNERPAEEFLWIQRRRLNRDRALEPPTWLREQPMRRGFGPALVKNDPNEERSSAHDDLSGTNSYGSAGKSDEDRLFRARQARGRHSRQSASEVYDEILKHLLEEATDRQALLDELYEELALKLVANQRSTKLQQSSSPNPVSKTPLAISELQKSQRLIQAGEQEDGMPAADLGPQDPLNSHQGPESDSTLVIVGDEVSGGVDDVTPLEVTSNTQSNTNVAYSNSKGPTYGDDEVSSIDVTNGPNTKPMPDLSARPDGSWFPGSSLFTSAPQTNIPDSDILSSMTAANPDDQISEAMKSLQQQQQQHQMQDLAMNSFHVVEDIDQDTDSSHETPLQSLPSPPGGDGGFDQVQQYADKTELTFPLMKSPSEKRAFVDQHKSDGSAFEGQYARKSGPVRLAQLKIVEPSKMPMEAEYTSSDDERMMSNNPREISKLMIIESDYFSKEQLLGAATKVKTYLENMLEIPQTSILGLYPLNSDKLLVQLDTNKLNIYQKINMMQNYDLSRGFIVMSWPVGSKQSPLPLLSAILRNLALKPGGAAVEALQAREASDQQPDGGETDLAAQWLLKSRTAPAHPFGDLQGERRFRWPPAQPEAVGAGRQSMAAAAGERVSMAVLAAYLSALYNNNNNSNNNNNNNNKGIESPEIAALPTEAVADELPQPLGSKSDAINHESYSELMLRREHFVHILAIMAALLGTFVVVKLLLNNDHKKLLSIRGRRFDPRGSFSSLWSRGSGSSAGASSSQSAAGELLGAPSKQAELEAAAGWQPAAAAASKPGFQSENAKEQVGCGARNSLDSLAQKLVCLLRPKRTASPRDEDEVSEGFDEVAAVAGAAILDGATENSSEDLADSGSGQGSGAGGSFRSSRSYIKSLIEVLSKARAHIPSSNKVFGGGNNGASGNNNDDEDEDDGLSSAGALVAEKRRLEARAAGCELPTSGECGNAKGSGSSGSSGNGNDTGILMSQMDISAAHLILAYMEKHLEDKERLRREWLEMNAAKEVAPGKNGGGSKANQLLLQRLAKVALSDENCPKNRNCLVVPFDRNRVRLGSASVSPAGSGARPKSAPPSARGDYINASYIYDDDPRKPTHIIAQGPSEQTCGHFWQMVWEQGVSVIVMLTRLNENSVRQCHCYWPTKSSDSQSSSPSSLAQQQQQPIPDDLSQSAAGASKTQIGRRGSVTSVYNSAQLPANLARANGAAGTNTGPANNNTNNNPIIANEDLGNNVLIFEIPSSQSATATKGSAGSNGRQRDRSDKERAPGGGKATSGGINKLEVHLVSEHVSSNDYLVRNMYIINRSTCETRTVTQFHFLAWPDNGLPENVKSFLQFRRKVHKSYRSLRSPILVHCSDGAGRAGTYTLIDLILERIRQGAKEIDLRATLEHLRDQRPGLCATLGQFEFVLVALAEEIQAILDALPQ